ncbi:MAG: sulfatase-like hydrolase/transferase, partial [Phycisphaeraceae bacterium]|nr:sulfatase-like hydrolase/transferase [Phycisphaeraceae bacterium]
WCLQIETFDPHEPFFSNRQYKDHFADHYAQWRASGGLQWDWPPYARVDEPPEYVEHMRFEYASLMAMCDAKLGSVLDVMDELALWDDTMLIVWTDHGFMLGEHDCWAKCWMPFYEEVAHTPFFVWDPRSKQAGVRREALVQPSIDVGPTLLDYFGVERTADMTGQALGGAVADDRAVRDAAIFGLHGGHVNVTDGKHVYMRGPAESSNGPLYNYTLMPTHMRHTFAPDELRGKTELVAGFGFTKGCATMRIESSNRMPGGEDVRMRMPTLLFDVEVDPQEVKPVDDAAVERRMVEHLMREMRAVDAPEEQFVRLGIEG